MTHSFLVAMVVVAALSSPLAAQSVEQWGVFEAALRGPADGNPFLDVDLSATFTHADRSTTAAGFYDGDGTYRVRFMPDAVGEWKYTTKSNRKELDGRAGTFTATKPTGTNRRPVRVRNKYHFGYADGTPYVPVGTTCYGWMHLGDEIEKKTLASLKTAPFNKVRMCVFPKWYAYNRTEPPRYPFAGTPPKGWDFTRFDPAFFRHVEESVARLRDLGIEADLILFHPYDKGHWGFDRMPADVDDRYVRYLVARLAAHRNVWWSLANEFDFLEKKTDADWTRLLKLVAATDPHHHLRSIHNGTRLFNHTEPLLTHASIQNGSAVADFGRAVLYRDVYEKPIVLDEVKYEGNLEQRWGNLTAEEMVHRCWQGAVAGAYVTHGETYKDTADMIWWSKGGDLRGQSPCRIAFLRTVLESGPKTGLDPIDKWQDVRTAGKKGEYYLIYFGKEKPTEWVPELPRAGLNAPLKLRAEILDTWDRTVTGVPGVFEFKPDGRYRLACKDREPLKLPGKSYLAIRLQLVGDR